MKPLSLARAAQIVDGSVAGDGSVVFTGAVADSRAQNAPGAVYVAIAGERVDGYEFIPSAAQAGAVAALATRPSDVLPTIVVANPVEALGALARAVVDALPGLTVVAVTGSSGKTTTKDLMAAVFTARGPVVAPAGSFNTEVGLPITALRCDESTATLIAEMGARGLGHVALLCGITPPDIAVVLNVGTAHLGEFGSRDAIAQAKAEIVEALPATGVAVLNADDPLVAAMAARTTARVLTFGTRSEAEVRATEIELDPLARASFTLSGPDADGRRTSARVTLRLPGEHNVSNALAAAAAALATGIELGRIATALSAAETASRWRMEVTTSSRGVIVVNDAYNANPDSMIAALKALAEMGRSNGARTFAVLGEMKELGDESTQAHDRIGRMAVRLNISRLVAVGEGARPIHLGAAHEGSWNGESTAAADVVQAIAQLSGELEPGDIVLVKASRSVGLERVAEALLALPEDVA